MHRFYLPPENGRGDTLALAGAEAHHALRVLRIKPGERVTVLDGVGGEYLCKVGSTSHDSAVLHVIEKTPRPKPLCRITLLQAIPKAKLIETIIQKGTELGVARIVPLLSERVVLQLEATERRRKAEKWQAVAIESIKQCGAAWLPEVLPPQSIADFLALKEQVELPLVACLQPDSKHPRQHFKAFRSQHHRNPTSACVWIGPEGDFTFDEYAAIKAAGALPITLGPLILRTDTAASYCLSVLNYESFAADA